MQEGTRRLSQEKWEPAVNPDAEVLLKVQNSLHTIPALDGMATEVLLGVSIADLKELKERLNGLVSSQWKEALLDQCTIRLRVMVAHVRRIRGDNNAISLRHSTRALSKADVDEMALVDRWGMRVLEAKTRTKKELARLKSNAEVEKRREKKWLVMIRAWDETIKKQADLVKRRVRKGVPDSLRGNVWPSFTGSNILRQRHEGLYTELLEMDSAFTEVIRRDIHRTFPEHVFFRADGSTGSAGKESLYNVLKAYSIHDADVGYTQGMGFIVGIFLMYVSEEESFWMLNCLLRSEKWQLHGMWAPGFPLLMQWYWVLNELMREHCPKLLRHMEEQGIVVSMYATQWFMTLFAAVLPYDATLRIFDIITHEGTKIMFRVAIWLLRRREKEILQCEFDTIMETINELDQDASTDSLVEAWLAVNITNKQIQRLMDAWVNPKDSNSRVGNGFFSLVSFPL